MSHQEIILTLSERTAYLDEVLRVFRSGRGWRVELDGDRLRVAGRYRRPLDPRFVVSRVSIAAQIESIKEPTK